jgi:hypothetical protein
MLVSVGRVSKACSLRQRRIPVQYIDLPRTHACFEKEHACHHVVPIGHKRPLLCLKYSIFRAFRD